MSRQLTRRSFLQIGSLFPFGLGITDFSALRQLAADETKSKAEQPAKSCILIWLDGGPSHLETFDCKPDAPVEVRGPLETIQTSLPGIHLSECLPETAKLMQQVAIVRSVTSPLGEHNFGTHYLMTGYRPTPVLEYPTMGGVATYLNQQRSALPAHIAIPDFRVGGGRISGAGYLPSKHAPFQIGSDPARPNFRVDDLDLRQDFDFGRLQRRQRYVNQLTSFSGDANAANKNDLTQALELIGSEEAKAAFDLSQETTATRTKYGPKTVGQSCLVARRLVERGAKFVTVNHRGWDTHADLVTRLKDGYTGAKQPVGLIPSLDLALSALIQDLIERGRFDETLVMVMGEFGRTPKLNTSGGRDHWPRVFSVLFAGGGISGGQVIGSSDATGESPTDRPVTPSDLVATVYTLLGIDPTLELSTEDGRPVRLTPHDAEVIHELLS